MSDPEAAAVEYLVGVRLREVAKAEDYLVAEDLELHVGDLVIVSMEGGQTVGEVRRPRRLLPDFKRDRPFPRVLRLATEAEAHEWRERRDRKSTRLNSSHSQISYAVFCLKKKKNKERTNVPNYNDT